MQHSEKRSKNLVWYLEQQLDIQLDMLKHQTEITKLVINQLLDVKFHKVVDAFICIVTKTQRTWSYPKFSRKFHISFCKKKSIQMPLLIYTLELKLEIAI